MKHGLKRRLRVMQISAQVNQIGNCRKLFTSDKGAKDGSNRKASTVYWFSVLICTGQQEMSLTRPRANQNILPVQQR